MATAGAFKVDVSSAYPCWVVIRRGDQCIHSVRHDELSDLEYCIKKAIQEAKRYLGERSDEV